VCVCVCVCVRERERERERERKVEQEQKHIHGGNLGREVERQKEGARKCFTVKVDDLDR
jgi:hypothetical protein